MNKLCYSWMTSWYSSKEKTSMWIISKLQNELNHIISWCINSEAVINHSTVTASWFSLNNHITKTETLNVTLLGDNLKTNSEIFGSGI